MSLRELLPRKTVSQESVEILSPVFQGEVLFKQNRLEQAAAKYREALKNFPPQSGGRILVYNKLGIVYEKLGNIHQAIEIYEICVGEGSITPFTYQRLACLYLDVGNLKKALNCCRRGIGCLKHANTDFFQEIYFWFIFQNIKRKIKHKLRRSGKECS